MKTSVVTLLLISLCGFLRCTDSHTDQTRKNKEIVAKAFEVVGTGDYDNFGTYIADDYVRHSQATPDITIASLDAFKEFIRQDRKSCPDQKFVIKELIAEGDLVAFWATYKATQTGQMGPFPPSNKAVALEFSGFHRLKEGKIVETWITWDNIAFLSQLGHFPPKPDTPGEN